MAIFEDPGLGTENADPLDNKHQDHHAPTKDKCFQISYLASQDNVDTHCSTYIPHCLILDDIGSSYFIKKGPILNVPQ